MATFTVVVQPQGQRWTQRQFPTLGEADRFARDRSAAGEGVAWTEVWDGTDPATRAGKEPLRYYELGERMNRLTGLPWTDDQSTVHG